VRTPDDPTVATSSVESDPVVARAKSEKEGDKLRFAIGTERYRQRSFWGRIRAVALDSGTGPKANAFGSKCNRNVIWEMNEAVFIRNRQNVSIGFLLRLK
jgi:hypothetical protein